MTDTCEVKQVHGEAVAKAREALSSLSLIRLAESFRVLGDPTRTGILIALGTGELCVCDLAELFGVTPGAISHQLRLLKAHRLVRSRREGKNVFYMLDDSHVAGLLKQGIDHVREERDGNA